MIDEEAIYQFLDELRESGKVNMFGAAPYLVEAFGFSKLDAREYVSKWMEIADHRLENEEE